MNRREKLHFCIALARIIRLAKAREKLLRDSQLHRVSNNSRYLTRFLAYTETRLVSQLMKP